MRAHTAAIVLASVAACERSPGVQPPASDLGDCVVPPPESVRACDRAIRPGCGLDLDSPWRADRVRFSMGGPDLAVPRTWDLGATEPWTLKEAPSGRDRSLSVEVMNAYGRVICRAELEDLEVDRELFVSVELARVDGPDRDGDGLADADEEAMGLDPDHPDSDRDGASDGDEVIAGLDPGTACSDCALSADRPDCDGDGLSNDAEELACTDPGNPDTDEDGLPDGLEDRDQDGRIDPGETSAIVADTDGDGLRDGDETHAGSSPLDASDAADPALELPFEPSDLSAAPDGSALVVVSRAIADGETYRAQVVYVSELGAPPVTAPARVEAGAPLVVVPWDRVRTPLEEQRVLVIGSTAIAGIGSQAPPRSWLSVLSFPSARTLQIAEVVDDVGAPVGRLSAAEFIAPGPGGDGRLILGAGDGRLFTVRSLSLAGDTVRVQPVACPACPSASVEAIRPTPDDRAAVALFANGDLLRIEEDGTAGVPASACDACFAVSLALFGDDEALVGGWDATGNFLMRVGPGDVDPRRIDTDSLASDVRTGARGRRAYALAANPALELAGILVVRIDPFPSGSGEVVGRAALPGGSPRQLVIGADGARLSVSSVTPDGRGRIMPLSLSPRLRPLHRAPVVGRPDRLWMSPCGTRAFVVGELEPSQIAIVDTDPRSADFLRVRGSTRLPLLTNRVSIVGPADAYGLGRSLLEGRELVAWPLSCDERAPPTGSCGAPECWDLATGIGAARSPIVVDLGPSPVDAAQLDGEFAFLADAPPNLLLGPPDATVEVPVAWNDCGLDAFRLVSLIAAPYGVLVHARGTAGERAADCLIPIALPSGSLPYEVHVTAEPFDRVLAGDGAVAYGVTRAAPGGGRRAVRVDLAAAVRATTVGRLEAGVLGAVLMRPSDGACGEELLALVAVETASVTLSGYLAAIDPCAGRVIRRSAVFESPARRDVSLVASPDGRTLWVADPAADQLLAVPLR